MAPGVDVEVALPGALTAAARDHEHARYSEAGQYPHDGLESYHLHQRFPAVEGLVPIMPFMRIECRPTQAPSGPTSAPPRRSEIVPNFVTGRPPCGPFTAQRGDNRPWSPPRRRRRRP